MNYDIENEQFKSRHYKWNWVQYSFACVGTVSFVNFMKYPIFQYYGAGWSVLAFIFYTFLIVAPIIYFQSRLGSQHCKSPFGLFAKHMPLLSGTAIVFIIRNMITILIHTTLLSHAFSYIIFTHFVCDRIRCIGSAFMWSSCGDTWCTPRCTQDEQRTRLGPTPEDEFYNNYVLNHVTNFTAEGPWGGFASWFNVPALHFTMLIAAWLAVTCTCLGGPRFYGYLLYGLCPTTIAIFVTLFVYGRVVVADATTIDAWWAKLYRDFRSFIPQNVYSIDPYFYQPLEWGWLGTLVVMTWSMQLWSGQYTSMASWVGYGAKKKFLVCIPPILIASILAHFPTFLMLSYFSFSYELNDYARFHLIKDYAVPFVLIPRAFSMRGTPRVFVTLWFILLALFTIMHVSLLFLSSVDSAVEFLRRCSRRIERTPPENVRRICAAIIIPVLFFCSIPLITRGGIFWILMMDRYLDRFLFVFLVIAGATYLICYARSTRYILEIVVGIALGIIPIAISFGAFLWWLIVDESYSQRIYDQYWPTWNEIPLPGYMVAIGWVIGVLPIPIGLLIGALVMFLRADLPFTERMRYMLCGSPEAEEPPSESVPISAEGGAGVARPSPFVLPSKQAAEPAGEKHPETVGLLYDGSAPQAAFAPPSYNNTVI